MTGVDECTWPPLAEPYAAALREAVAYILGRWQPVGIVASGTIVRGNPGPSSDLDLVVVHRQLVRQRVQRFFRDVPAEIFVNPPAQIERYLAEEQREGRPVMAHMIATGAVVLEADGTVARLREQAEELLAAGPELSDSALIRHRYTAATWLEDALDIADADPEMCAALLGEAVLAAVRYRFLAAGQWLPRHKELLSALGALDGELATLARQFERGGPLPERVRLAREVVQRSVDATGFFEWESEPEDVPAGQAPGQVS